VTIATDIAPPKNASRLAARIGWAALIVATLYVCYFSHLGAIGFVGPDEPRYAWIARDMAETGDWVTPRLYGMPWFEKPPLYYWGAAICFRLFGVSEAAARLPSAISALLATLAMAWLGWRICGAETARWLLLLLPTTVGMIGFSHAAATDMPFSAMLTIAMVCAALLLRLPSECGGLGQLSPNKASATESTGTLATPPASSSLISFTSSTSSTAFTSLLFGFFLGLAVLAKGPAAIILCGGAVCFWALFSKRWRDALRLLHPAAIATFCVTALPWYILCARRNPDFFRIFIIEHNFKRYLTPEFQHIQPFWFYLPVLCIALLPWTAGSLILAKDAAYSWRDSGWRSSPTLFLVCWIVAPIIFFSISKSKLPGYVLPAIPPLGLLVARAFSARVHNILSGDRWIGITTGITLTALGILTFMQIKLISFGWVPSLLTTSGIVMLMLSVQRRLASALLVGVVAAVVTVALTFAGSTGQSLDQRLSARPTFSAAQMIWKDFSPERVSTHKLQRSFQFSLNFYFHRELPDWSPGSQHGWVFAPRSEISDLRNRGLNCPVVFWYAVIVCEDPGSATHAASSGKPQ
jgi:4-amino-4-deoxy-L-arabinose transferase-like glycosyltransferase